ncbi:MAG: DNA-processing protein DprA [Dehalococcoidia bacterium]|jgi:DNA processing protein
MQDNEIQYLIGFTRSPGIGKVRLNALKDHFGSLELAWKAPKSELIRAGLDDKIADSLVECRTKISLEKELNLIEKYHIKVIPFDSSEYPPLLREIHDYPAVIYVRGMLKALIGTCIAIVGTRRATAYGRQVTEELAGSLAMNNITIISGLAKGIDTAAHRAAIDASGQTVAVFASGLDIVYPPENLNLAREIMEHGALVSEFPLGIKPKADNFPRRNRILSGLSCGVVVIESGENSGALITANFALEQNREVFAVPGSVLSPMSKGPNKLIQEGAKLVRNYMDIIDELNLSVVSQQLEMEGLAASNEIESHIISCMTDEPTHIDEICRNTGMNTSMVVSNLAIMEFKGLVHQIGSMSYVLSNNLLNKKGK